MFLCEIFSGQIKILYYFLRTLEDCFVCKTKVFCDIIMPRNDGTWFLNYLCYYNSIISIFYGFFKKIKLTLTSIENFKKSQPDPENFFVLPVLQIVLKGI